MGSNWGSSQMVNLEEEEEEEEEIFFLYFFYSIVGSRSLKIKIRSCIPIGHLQ